MLAELLIAGIAVVALASQILVGLTVRKQLRVLHHELMIYADRQRDVRRRVRRLE